MFRSLQGNPSRLGRLFAVWVCLGGSLLSAQDAAPPVTAPSSTPERDSAAESDAATVASADGLQRRHREFVEAFNRGDIEALVGSFAADGELIDEQGFLYRGRDELKALFEGFFASFPGARLDIQVDSLRALGNAMAIEEGTRWIEAADRGSVAAFRYVSVYSRSGDDWLIHSIREAAVEPIPTIADRLAPLASLEGEWVNEGAEANVEVRFRWNAERTYLLGEFRVVRPGEPPRSTSQRIGWDPLQQRIRSWTFEADGGFSQGEWTPTETGFLIKSSAVLADGTTGSATLRMEKDSSDRLIMKGTDRVVGTSVGEDFEITIVRRPRLDVDGLPSIRSAD